MPGGRPTDDPKTKLVAVRLAPRQVRWLERRARREGITVSEALRRVLEEATAWARGATPVRKHRGR